MRNGKARKGKFIAVANMKGGVGKTTTVVSIAEALSVQDSGLRVLVVDMDAQASASICIAGPSELAQIIEEKRTLDHLLDAILVRSKQIEIKPFISEGISQVTHGGDQLDVSLLAASPLLRSFERDLIYALSRRRLSLDEIDGHLLQSFKTYFDQLRSTYDYVLFDCAPGISPITEIAIRTSDLVIVPTIPDFLSVYGLKMFCDTLWRADAADLSMPKPKKLPHVLVTKYQAGIKQHKDTCIDLRERSRQRDPYFVLFETVVNQSAYMANAMADTSIPTFGRKYSSLGARLLDPLVREIRGAT